MRHRRRYRHAREPYKRPTETWVWVVAILSAPVLFPIGMIIGMLLPYWIVKLIEGLPF